MTFNQLKILVCGSALVLSTPPAFADVAAPVPTCPRPPPGSAVAAPHDLFSHGGVLNVTLDYLTALDADNRTLFCLVTPEGAESPTLHVRPGDTLNIALRNKLPPLPAGSLRETMSQPSDRCGAAFMDATSVNLHFHGTNTSPACHADNAIHTLVNAGQTFNFSLTFPRDEPSGLYWYHPHVHGIAEAALLGGASGAIVVEGIETVQPDVAGLGQRLLVIRDQTVAGNPAPGGQVPSWDLSLNYVPISYPSLVPAVITLPPNRREFWRVVNASADSVTDLQLRYDGVVQKLKLVALDGVATGSQDGTRHGRAVEVTHLLLPPAGRAEFIITTPSPEVKHATLETLKVQTGPFGDNDTARTLATLSTKAGRDDDQAMAMPDGAAAMGAMSDPPGPQRYEGLDQATVTAHRKLYFSEVPSIPNDPASPTNFYITVDGATPTVFNAANPPAIDTTQGAVEDWTIENRTQEVHEFHIHQIHFKLFSVDGVPVADDQRQFRDTVQVPFWSGQGPFPSVMVRLDFRGNITGDFVYHCHILGHEDNGMMAIIRVHKRPPAG